VYPHYSHHQEPPCVTNLRKEDWTACVGIRTRDRKLQHVRGWRWNGSLRQIFHAFVAAGGTTFDVSNIYQDGQAETVLGELLGQDRGDYVVITSTAVREKSDLARDDR